MHETASSGGDVVAMGPMASVTTLPPMFAHTTLLVGGRSINGTMTSLGQALLRESGKQPVNPRNESFVLSHLGYWVDNGAPYYHTTGLYLKTMNFTFLMMDFAFKLTCFVPHDSGVQHIPGHGGLQVFATKFIILNAKFIILNAKSIIFKTKFIILNTKLPQRRRELHTRGRAKGCTM